MKNITQYLLVTACVLGIAAVNAKLTAADDTAADASLPACCTGMSACMTPVAATDTNAVPDLLKTCPVSGEKLGGDMGKPFRFVYKGQEVLLCCKGCKKDFDKDPAKYIKLIRAADKK
jgi:YHS domain-containing protein